MDSAGAQADLHSGTVVAGVSDGSRVGKLCHHEREKATPDARPRRRVRVSL